jgi:hypothetical protein
VITLSRCTSYGDRPGLHVEDGTEAEPTKVMLE